MIARGMPEFTKIARKGRSNAKIQKIAQDKWKVIIFETGISGNVTLFNNEEDEKVLRLKNEDRNLSLFICRQWWDIFKRWSQLMSVFAIVTGGVRYRTSIDFLPSNNELLFFLCENWKRFKPYLILSKGILINANWGAQWRTNWFMSPFRFLRNLSLKPPISFDVP